MTDIIDRAFSF